MLDVIATTVLTSVSFTVILLIGFRFFEKRLYGIVDSIAELFTEALTQPAVSRAMGVLGKKSGEARSNTAIVDKLASDVLSGPKMNALKMGASAIGIDIDDYIQEHGAVGTLQGLQTIAGALGIDVNQIIGGGLGELTSGATSTAGSNPYL